MRSPELGHSHVMGRSGGEGAHNGAHLPIRPKMGVQNGQEEEAEGAHAERPQAAGSRVQ